MSGRAVHRYRRLLATSGAARFFPPAAVARLGVAMSHLSVLWAVHGVAGSFVEAGVATGAFALADALAGPQLARLIDSRGQLRVVPVTAATFAVACAALAWGCARGWPLPMLVVLAGLAGASAPPVGALSAARWRHLLAGEGGLPTALALEGAVNDVSFLIGPVLVTTLSATTEGWAGLVSSAALVLIGTTGLLTATASEPLPTPRARGLLVDPRLMHAGPAALFAANLSMGLFFGGVPVAVTAFCLAHGVGALAGVVSAVSSVLSLLAGLIYGGLERARPLRIMTVVSLLVAAATAMLSLIPNVPGMFVAYGLVGGGVALILIPGSVLLQAVTAPGVYTQAMTWMNSASAVGIAVASPLVGYAVQQGGWPVGFLVTAALTATLPLGLLVGRSALGTASASVYAAPQAGPSAGPSAGPATGPSPGPQPVVPHVWDHRIMIGLIVVLLVIWAVLAILGFVLHGLVWLAIIGIVLFVATSIFGFFQRRSARG